MNYPSYLNKSEKTNKKDKTVDVTLYQLHNLTPTKKDQLDAGFRPLTFTGLYAAP